MVPRILMLIFLPWKVEICSWSLDLRHQAPAESQRGWTQMEAPWCRQRLLMLLAPLMWALDMHSMRPSMRPEILFATWSTQHMVFLYRCCILSPNVFLLPLSRSLQQGSPFEKASVLTQWQLKWHCQLVFYCGSLWFRYVLAKKAHMPIGIGHMFAQNTLCIQCYSASGIEQMIFTYVRHGMACSISWHLLRPGATNQEKPGEYFDCIDEFSVHLLLSHGLPRQLLPTDPWGRCCESSWSNGASLAWRRWHADFCCGLFDACTFDWQLPAPLRGADFWSVRLLGFNLWVWSEKTEGKAWHANPEWSPLKPFFTFSHVFTLVPDSTWSPFSRFHAGTWTFWRWQPDGVVTVVTKMFQGESSVRWVFFRSPWWLSLSAICLASSSPPMVALLSPGRSEMLVLRRKDWQWLVF